MKSSRWSQPLRVEDSDMVWLCTSKTINSVLWLVNNKKLEERILGYLAKYQHEYGIIIYAFVIQGNHYHLLAKFPQCNRADFFRDFNARIAEAVRACVAEFEGGPLFSRRYTIQATPLDVDVEDKFFYCALQSVNAGLTQRISDYPGYNSFHDASHNIKREFRVINWAQYNQAKKRNPDTNIRDYVELYTLTYSRLPNHKGKQKTAYRNMLCAELERKRTGIIAQHKKQGKVGYLTKDALLKVIPGSTPFSTKKGGRRPLVLSRCPEAKKAFLERFFDILTRYWKASKDYLSGNKEAEFPSGTYKPPGPYVAHAT